MNLVELAGIVKYRHDSHSLLIIHVIKVCLFCWFLYIVTPQLTINNPMVSAVYGESVQLTCNHANPDATNPITVRWYKNSTLLFTGEKYTISTTQQTHSYALQIHNVSENDEGMYKCIADSLYSSPSVEMIQLTGSYM